MFCAMFILFIQYSLLIYYIHLIIVETLACAMNSIVNCQNSTCMCTDKIECNVHVQIN